MLWFWVIVIVAVIGGVLGYIFSDGESRAGDAAGGAFTAGCMAAGCMWRILLAGLGIFFVIWLFRLLFG